MKPNRWGCKPKQDVCMAHSDALMCPHGCCLVAEHSCAFLKDRYELASAWLAQTHDVPPWAERQVRNGK